MTSPISSGIRVNPFRSDASKKLKEGIPDDDQTLKESSAGAASLRSGIKQTHSVRRLPSKKDLTEQLQVSTKALDKAKKETYQKKFQLWMPMIHIFDENSEDDEEIKVVDLLPVDELLDRVTLKRVRIAAVERSLVFLFFLFLYCATLYLQRSLADSYQLEAALKKQIQSGEVKFSELDNVDDIWTWMESSLLESVVPGDTWYNGEPLEDADQGYSFFYQKQCGGFSLVQHRVKEFSSESYTPDFVGLYPTVWPNLGGETSTKRDIGSGDDREPFGPSHDPFRYVWAPDSAGEFQGGGYMVQFPTKRKKVKYLIKEMKADRFIDKKTRKLMFIVTKFNANLRLFAVIQFEVTINAAGDVSTQTALRSVRVNQFVNFRDVCRVFVECATVFLMILQTAQELKTLLSVGFRAYVNFWNIIDGARQFLFYYSVVAYITLMSDVIRQQPAAVEDMCNGGEWQNFPKLAKLEDDYVFVSALVLLVSTLLIFKFLTPFPKIGIFVHTMVSAGGDLLNFTVVLSILLFGYAIMGHLLFGHVLENYSTISAAVESAIFFSIGDVDYESLVAASSYTAAAIYFYSFLFIITIVVMQMVIAIIFNAYDGLRELINVSEELYVRPVLVRKLLLGREPSIWETHTPLFDVLQRQFSQMSWKRFWKPFSQRVHPLDSATGGKTLDAESFSDDDLLNLFDPQHVFRVYGILPTTLEGEIVSVKKMVAAERLKEAVAAGADRTQAADDIEQRHSEIDPWSLDTREFCALLHVLDEHDDEVNVNDSTEMRIAQHIFSAYGRQKTSKLKGRQGLIQKIDDHNKEMGEKLDSILRILQNFDERSNEVENDSNTNLSSEKSKMKSPRQVVAESSAVNSEIVDVSTSVRTVRTTTGGTGFFREPHDQITAQSTTLPPRSHSVTNLSSMRRMRRGKSAAVLGDNQMTTFVEDVDEQDESFEAM